MNNNMCNEDIKITGLNHITFSVEDINKSIEFYKIVLDAKLLAKGDKLAYFDIAGIWVALNLEENIPGENREKTYTHIAFSMTESDQDKLIEKLKQHGIKYELGRPRNTREGKSLYIRDYDGHLIELHSKTRTDRLKYYLDERPDIKVFNE
ncbi:VOC family protein [Clostridiaceae bacterium M8S5]|nr:VOC family protein [Clostridiaceae bacterium M8S5]